MQANYWRKAKTIHQGQADDLKKETPKLRIWVSRCEVEDEPGYSRPSIYEIVENRDNLSTHWQH